jgi:hypothetical protein
VVHPCHVNMQVQILCCRPILQRAGQRVYIPAIYQTQQPLLVGTKDQLLRSLDTNH